MAEVDDESADIYDDLPDFRYDETLDKLNATVRKLLSEKNQLLNELSEMAKEKSKLESTCRVLNTNVSSLLKTAKLEIQRKDRTIEDLRKKLNDTLPHTKRRFGVRRGDLTPEKVIRNKLMRADRETTPRHGRLSPVKESPRGTHPDLDKRDVRLETQIRPLPVKNVRVEPSLQAIPVGVPVFNASIPPPPVFNTSIPPPVFDPPIPRPPVLAAPIPPPPAYQTVFSARMYKKMCDADRVKTPDSATSKDDLPTKREPVGSQPPAVDVQAWNRQFEAAASVRLKTPIPKPPDSAQATQLRTLDLLTQDQQFKTTPKRQTETPVPESPDSSPQELPKPRMLCKGPVASSKKMDELVVLNSHKRRSFPPPSAIESSKCSGIEVSAISDVSVNSTVSFQTNSAIKSVTESAKLHPVVSNTAVNVQTTESVAKPTQASLVRSNSANKSGDLCSEVPPKVVPVEEKENLDSETKLVRQQQQTEQLVCNEGPSKVSQNGQDLLASKVESENAATLKKGIRSTRLPTVLKLKLIKRRSIAPISSGWDCGKKQTPDTEENNDVPNVYVSLENPRTGSATASAASVMSEIKETVADSKPVKQNNLVEAMFGSPLKWADDCSSESVPIDEPGQKETVNNTMLSLFGASCKNIDSSGSEPAQFLLPSTAYEDSCLTSTGADKPGSRSPIKNASASQSNDGRDTRPEVDKRGNLPPPSLPLRKMQSIFSPLKDSRTKYHSIHEERSRSHTGLYFPFRGKGYEDSVLGQFDDTAQFVSALAKVDTKLSPLNTPVKPESSLPLCSKNNLTSFSEVFQKQIPEESVSLSVLPGKNDLVNCAASTPSAARPAELPCEAGLRDPCQQTGEKAKELAWDAKLDVPSVNLSESSSIGENSIKDITTSGVESRNPFPPPKFPNGPVNILEPRKTPRTTTSKFPKSPQPIDLSVRRVAISETLVTRVTERVKKWEEDHLFENTLRSMSMSPRSSPTKSRSPKISPKSKKQSPKRSPASHCLLGQQQLDLIATMCKPVVTVDQDSTAKAINMIRAIVQKAPLCGTVAATSNPNVATQSATQGGKEHSCEQVPKTDKLIAVEGADLGDLDNVLKVNANASGTRAIKMTDETDVCSGFSKPEHAVEIEAKTSVPGPSAVQMESVSLSSVAGGVKVNSLRVPIIAPKPVLKNQNFKRSSAFRNSGTNESPSVKLDFVERKIVIPQVGVKPTVIKRRREANFGFSPSKAGIGLSASEIIVHSSVFDEKQPKDEWLLPNPIDFRHIDIYQNLPDHAKLEDPRRRPISKTQQSQSMPLKEPEDDCGKAAATLRNEHELKSVNQQSRSFPVKETEDDCRNASPMLRSVNLPNCKYISSIKPSKDPVIGLLPKVKIGKVKPDSKNQKKPDEWSKTAQEPKTPGKVAPQRSSSLSANNDGNSQTARTPRKTIMLDVPMRGPFRGKKQRASSPVDLESNSSSHLRSDKTTTKPSRESSKRKTTETTSPPEIDLQQVSHITESAFTVTSDCPKWRRSDLPDDQEITSRRHPREKETTMNSSRKSSSKRKMTETTFPPDIDSQQVSKNTESAFTVTSDFPRRRWANLPDDQESSSRRHPRSERTTMNLSRKSFSKRKTTETTYPEIDAQRVSQNTESAFAVTSDCPKRRRASLPGGQESSSRRHPWSEKATTNSSRQSGSKRKTTETTFPPEIDSRQVSQNTESAFAVTSDCPKRRREPDDQESSSRSHPRSERSIAKFSRNPSNQKPTKTTSSPEIKSQQVSQTTESGFTVTSVSPHPGPKPVVFSRSNSKIILASRKINFGSVTKVNTPQTVVRVGRPANFGVGS